MGSRKPNGTGYQHPSGYEFVRVGKRRIGRHQLVAEQALGHSLPKGAVVHHMNGDRGDNRPENLAILPGQKYHALIHIRHDAMLATGDPDKRKCPFCGRYDDKANMRRQSGKQEESYMHVACASAATLAARRRRKNAERVAA